MTNYKKITHNKDIIINSKDINWSSDKQSFILNYKWCTLHKNIFKVRVNINNQNLEEYYPFSLLSGDRIQIYYPKCVCDWIKINLHFNPIIIENNNSYKTKSQTYTFKYSNNFENNNKRLCVGVVDANKQYVFCGYKYLNGVLSVVVPNNMTYPINIFVVDKSVKNNPIQSINYVVEEPQTM